MIRITLPSIDESDLEAVRSVVASGFLVQGKAVAELERQVAALVGTRHAVAVTNCTAALQLALLALDVAAGDIVVTSTYSWPATANAVELCGARPVFVDIDPRTFNMDPARLEAVLATLMADADTARRVKAVLPVHAFGQMADMRAMQEIAGRYDLPIVEDAACALGATLDGRQAGSWGIAGCFSFHPRKAITTGEGGLVTTDSDEIARKLRALRNHGLDPDSATPDFVMAGFNCRITEFQGALGVSQLAKLERIVAARRRAATVYDGLLKATDITPPSVATGQSPVYQSYVTLLPAGTPRSHLVSVLYDGGVQTTIGTYHVPLTTFYRSRYGFREGDFPATDAIASRAFTLPLYEGLTHDDQETVVTRVTAELAVCMQGAS